VSASIAYNNPIARTWLELELMAAGQAEGDRAVVHARGQP
jgi:hypothetical protein